MRWAGVMVMSVVLGLALTASADGAAPGGRTADQPSSAAHAKASAASAVQPTPQPAAVLRAVGARKVRAPIPIRGRVQQATGINRLVLQRQAVARNRWTKLASKRVGNGGYRFAPRHRRTPGTVAFRTVLFAQDQPVAVSNVITVRVVARHRWRCVSAPSPTNCTKPRSVLQRRAVTDAPNCQQLTVTTRNQTRTVRWRWSTASRRWVQAPTPWVTVSTSKPPASAAQCLKVVSQMPSGAARPDLRIKDLTTCNSRDQQATGGTCFMIVASAPFNASFPDLEGRKLLKFGGTTSNVGAGLGEIIADRSAECHRGLEGVPDLLRPDRRLGSVVTPNVEFYFAGDGHHHWHVRDFDSYELLNARGTSCARGEARLLPAGQHHVRPDAGTAGRPDRAGLPGVHVVRQGSPERPDDRPRPEPRLG